MLDPGKFVMLVGDSSENTPLHTDSTLNESQSIRLAFEKAPPSARSFPLRKKQLWYSDRIRFATPSPRNAQQTEMFHALGSRDHRARHAIAQHIHHGAAHIHQSIDAQDEQDWCNRQMNGACRGEQNNK